DLFLAATIGAYPALSTGSAIRGTTVDAYPSFERIVFGNGFRPAIGAYYADATFPTLLNGMTANPAPNATGLSAAHLKKLKSYAERGGSGINKEDAIQPAFVRSKAGWPMNKYI